MLATAKLNFLHAKAEHNMKKIEYVNAQEAHDAAADAVSDYKDNHEKVKNDSYYLNLKATEDKLERDEERLKEDVELLEGEMKALEDLMKSENKEFTGSLNL